MRSARNSATIVCGGSGERSSLPVRPLAIILQITGLVTTLGALFWFGFQPRMGPMMYTAMVGAGLFYLGTFILKRRA